MYLRFLAVLAAAGLFHFLAIAQQPTPPAAPVATPPRAVAPPKPCDAACPAKVTLPSGHYLENHPPQYFPEEPRFAATRDLSYQELAARLVSRSIVRSYAVADLVGSPAPVRSCCALAKDKPNIGGADLIKKITAAVEPKSWSSAGGAGTIEYYPLGMALVVDQSPEVHEKVEQFLQHLRKFQDHQIAVELCIVTVTDAWMDKCARGLLCDTAGQDPPSAPCTDLVREVMRRAREAYDAQNYALAKELAEKAAAMRPSAIHDDRSDGTLSEAATKKACPCEGECSRSTRTRILTPETIETHLRSAKADLGTSIMAAPRVTSLNGQSAVVRIGQIERFITGVNVKSVNGNLIYVPKTDEHEMGVALTLDSMVTEDGKVHLSVSGTVREHAVLPVPMTPLTTVVQPVKEKGKNGEPVPFTQYIQEPKIMTRMITDSVAIPDGGSAVFYGGKATIEATVKERLPTLSDVPVLADLFAKDKKTTTTNHLLVVATAHVIRPDSDVEPCAACCPEGKLAKLMADYKRACREGKTDDARRLAIECLAIDATCFGAK